MLLSIESVLQIPTERRNCHMIPEEGSILCEKPGICKFIMYDKVRVNVLPYLASSHANIIQSGRGDGGRAVVILNKPSCL